MGIELPETVLKQLQLQAQSGLLDWRACVQALDGYVFKYRTLVDDVPRESVNVAKEKLMNVVTSSVSSFSHFFIDWTVGVFGFLNETFTIV